jgi:hypothetical protein
VKFCPVIITCPGREALQEQTLASWRQTDFPGAPLIQLDTNQHERRQERQEHNSLAALKAAIRALARERVELEAPEFILFMEDDLIFNRHLRHNLERWPPLVDFAAAQKRDGTTRPSPQPSPVPTGEGAVRGGFFGSLYDCTIRELERHDAAHYFIADPEAVYGSQCYVLSLPLARYLVDHWWEVPGMQDIKMSRLAARQGPIYYHTPSLVQHVGVVSAWGGRFHQTRDFSAEFKAEV